MSNLSLVDLKIDEIIDTLLSPEVESPPEKYRNLAEYLTAFKLQNSQNSLESIRSMISTFKGNREVLEEDYESFDESAAEPDNGEILDYEPEETGGAYADDESFFNEFGYAQSLLSPVEYRVFIGLVMELKKEFGGYSGEFLIAIQETLVNLGFSIPQVYEIMNEHLNPDSWRFAGMQQTLDQGFVVPEYN